MGRRIRQSLAVELQFQKIVLLLLSFEFFGEPFRIWAFVPYHTSFSRSVPSLGAPTSINVAALSSEKATSESNDVSSSKSAPLAQNDKTILNTTSPIPKINKGSTSQELILKTLDGRSRCVKFISPLLEYGYKPAVESFESGDNLKKPLLLYLPGFDSTFLSPFLQFPELDTIFDVRCMTVPTRDRSTYDELKSTVIEYLESESLVDRSNNATQTKSGLLSRWFGRKEVRRPIYLAGESFGGILAVDVALTLLKEKPQLDFQGLCLINAATCFDRSRLAAEGPPVTKYPTWLYPFGLLKLLPMFTDEYSFDQLLLILKGQGLPSVIDDETREAYMGRVAFSLPFVIPYMDQGALEWRLTEWLSYGCNQMLSRLSQWKKFGSFRTLIVAGEKDACLPSIEEAERLASLLPPRTTLHVVEGAGHASTCGARVDLAALFRSAFSELKSRKYRRTSMKEEAAAGTGPYLGMEPRYDNATIGLNPLKYWNRKYFKSYTSKPSLLALANNSNVTTATISGSNTTS